jgi:hypothetical protein
MASTGFYALNCLDLDLLESVLMVMGWSPSQFDEENEHRHRHFACQLGLLRN